MTTELLYIVVPTILVLVVLICYMNSRNKAVMKEISKVKIQLENMDNVPVASESAVADHRCEKNGNVKPVTAEDRAEVRETGENDKKDAVRLSSTDVAASAYNTGKSGKIYTKEELELLIKE